MSTDFDPEGAKLPIKLDSTSNGEFAPIPLDPTLRRGNELGSEQATTMARRLGLGRREFLVSASTLPSLRARCRGTEARGRVGRRVAWPRELPRAAEPGLHDLRPAHSAQVREFPAPTVRPASDAEQGGAARLIDRPIGVHRRPLAPSIQGRGEEAPPPSMPYAMVGPLIVDAAIRPCLDLRKSRAIPSERGRRWSSSSRWQAR